MAPPSPDSPLIPVGLSAQLRRHAPRYVLGVALLATYQVVQFVFNSRLRDAVNEALDQQTGAALIAGVHLLLLALGAFALRVLSRVAVFNAGRYAEYELRQGLLQRLQQLGPAFYRRMSTGEILSRATNDLTQVRLLLGFAVLNVINTPFALIGSLSFLLSVSVPLTLASFVTLPLTLLAMRYFGRNFYSRTRANQEGLGAMSDVVQTSLAGVRVVRSFALEERERARFERASQDYLERNLALGRLRGLMGPILVSIQTVGALVVFWYGGELLLRGALDPGAFIAFLRALGQLTWPLVALGFIVSIVQRGRAAFARVEEVYRAEPEIQDGTAPAPAEPRGRLEVRGLGFAYDGAPVLSDVAFTLEPGASLAIVGRTGAGKSTLALLLARLLPTPPGTVFLDGQDVCALPVDAVRGAVGYAQQTAFLFSTTVARNVAFCLDEPDTPSALDAVREAMGEARVLDEVLGLPDGFDTIVGERGVQLSGGQRQRVSLARAFVASAPILVLDDPLSAVDLRTESEILDAIDRQRARRSVILITHRIAAATRCDRILVLDEGRVIEHGSHAELLAAGGLYAEFAEEQRLERELSALSEATVGGLEAPAP
jgi:ATP-binding cassette subfamily B multidrug efflux pump